MVKATTIKPEAILPDSVSETPKAMAKPAYIYHGPVTPLALDQGKDPIMLITGKAYDNLPDDHPRVQRMKAKHILTPKPGDHPAPETPEA